MQISHSKTDNQIYLITPGEYLIQDCYARSVSLLKKNSTPTGVIACTRSKKAVNRSYASIFGRDAAICSLGMIASKEKELIQCAKISLLTLAQYQAPNGQIPKYVKPELQEVDFWYSGCIDATLWWLIAVNFFDRFFPEEQFTEQLHISIDRALNWLFCQEHQGMFLLQQNEASDWADIMPRSGFVLYTNALWYYIKRLYKVPTTGKTRYYFKTIFFPFDKAVPEHRRVRILTHYIKNNIKRSDFYLSFVNFSFWGEEIDVFGNILSALFGLAYASKASRIVNTMLHLGIHQPYPIRVIHKPIQQKSLLWRPYMERHKQNLPYQYHNGGIWPFVSGFWIMLLAKLGKKELAWKELERFAEANKVNNWEFNEWFHGKTGKPMGMTGQSWNAAMFILAFHTLQDNIRLP
ncbi:MAG: glycoside hydrolase [wastewater metagenome]|nr:glycoside hydrolase [Candidatus Loosdrechtia aerotolerans]